MRFFQGVLAVFALCCAAQQPMPEPQAKTENPAATTSTPPATTPASTPTAATAAPATPPVAKKPAQPYSGHGATSVPKEVLERFAPRALPDSLTRAIQGMLDVRAP